MNIKKTTKTGNYTEISYLHRTDRQQAYYKSGKRSRKSRASSEKQQQQNIKNANKRLKQLISGNFRINSDLFSTFTFDKSLSLEDVRQSVRQFIELLRPVYAFEGVPLKYVYVIECGENSKRLHVHFVLSNCPRSKITAAWSCVQNSGNVTDIQRIKSIDKVVAYLTKNPVGKQRYTSSRNLIRPVEQCEQVSEKEHRAALAAVILDDRAGKRRICRGNAPIETYISRNPATSCKGVYFTYFDGNQTEKAITKKAIKSETVPHCRI